MLLHLSTKSFTRFKKVVYSFVIINSREKYSSSPKKKRIELSTQKRTIEKPKSNKRVLAAVDPRWYTHST